MRQVDVFRRVLSGSWDQYNQPGSAAERRASRKPPERKTKPSVNASRAGISSFHLKVIAIVAMTCNHAAYLFHFQLPFSLFCIFEGVGGLTFPIMAFLLTEGFRHTSNMALYLGRLAVFAVIAQIPYGMFLGPGANVLFTLLLGLILLNLRKVLKGTTKKRAAFWIAVAASLAVSVFFDWGVIGIIMILLAGTAETERQRALRSPLLAAAALGIPAVFWFASGEIAAIPSFVYALGCAAAGGLLLFYDGSRGRPMKWFFYIYYPAHILVLGVISTIVG